MPKKRNTRGLRNNNPGNIDYNPKIKWQGLDNPPIEPKPLDGSRARFCRFKDEVYGIRALARVLITYYDKAKSKDGTRIDTIKEAIERWAPAVENNTGAYIRQVDAKHRRSATEVFNFHNYEDLRPLVCAIIEHENGLKSYREAYTDEQIDEGLRQAGVRPPAKPLRKEKEVQGGTVATVTTTANVAVEKVVDFVDTPTPPLPADPGPAAEAIDQVKTALEPVSYYSTIIQGILVVLTIAGVAWMIWGYYQKRKAAAV